MFLFVCGMFCRRRERESEPNTQRQAKQDKAAARQRDTSDNNRQQQKKARTDKGRDDVAARRARERVEQRGALVHVAVPVLDGVVELHDLSLIF